MKMTFGKPAWIHNADDSGHHLNKQAPPEIVSMKGKKNLRREVRLTLVTYLSAVGVFMPSYIIFKGENFK